jgi:predicted SprT family Zn-dependent metalloprotease
MNLVQAHFMAATLIQRNLPGWRFDFDRARKRFGCCYHVKQLITLSEPLTLLNDEDQVRDVILHEIAHARAGHRAGHGPLWRVHARAMGARPERCYRPTVVTPAAPYVAPCQGCKHPFKMFRRPKRERSCSRCSGGRFNRAFLLVYQKTA